MECTLNLEAFKKFVLHGSPSKDDGLYPLPYNAYKGNNSKNGKEKTETDVTDNATAMVNGKGSNSVANTKENKNNSVLNRTNVDHSGVKLCSNKSSTAIALSTDHNDTVQEKSVNRKQTVDFDSLSEDIDAAYSTFQTKKVQ